MDKPQEFTHGPMPAIRAMRDPDEPQGRPIPWIALKLAEDDCLYCKYDVEHDDESVLGSDWDGYTGARLDDLLEEGEHNPWPRRSPSSTTPTAPSQEDD